MRKFKYIFIPLIFFTTVHTAKALSVQYGTLLSTKGVNILIQYYGIGVKKNFICNITTHICKVTKKLTLSVDSTSTLTKSIRQELEDKKVGHITLAPNSALVAFYKGGTNLDPNRTYTIRDVKNNNEYAIARSLSYWDLVDDQARVFDFSLDSKKLVYIDDSEGTLGLYLVETNTLSHTTFKSNRLATTAYQVNDFIFTDNNTLYYIGNSKTNQYLWSLYRYNLTTGKDILIESNVSYVDPIKKVGQTLIFNRLEQRGYGPEIYNLKNKKIEQFKIPNINTTKKAHTQEIVKIGSASGILMPAKDKKRPHPLIIWLHGGPYRQTSYGYHPYHSYGLYDSILELLQKNNINVLKLDYRGSFGFGRSYAEGIKGSVGLGDVTDVMDAVIYIKKKYNVSDVYLIGNSYGGYLSLKALVEHPETFAGVMSINGVTNWESLLVSMKISIFNTQFNGLPNMTNRGLYDQASIINKIDTVGNQKISIIAGMADKTIPYSQATTFYDYAKAQHKNITLVSYPGEDHVYKEKKTLSDLCTQMFTFVGVPVDKECK